MRLRLPAAAQGGIQPHEGRKFPETGKVDLVRPAPSDEQFAHAFERRRLHAVIGTGRKPALLLRHAQKIFLRDTAVPLPRERGEHLGELFKEPAEIGREQKFVRDPRRGLLCGTAAPEGEQRTVARRDFRSLRQSVQVGIPI